MNTTIDYFDFYTNAGFRIIPLFPNSKIPVWSNWHQNYHVERSRNYIIKNKRSNIGLLLGNIVDVEGDTEESNEILLDILGSYPHPTYQSSKSVHHIFINPDPTLTATRFSGIEFRAQKHQSVIPPSRHEDGTSYVWLSDDFSVPPMPPKLQKLYWENRKRKNVKILKPEHIATVCNCCQAKVMLHKKRLILEVKAFTDLQTKWICQKCRSVDLRPACRKIRKAMRHKN